MKKQMRMLLAILLAALLCSACGGTKKPEATAETGVETEAVTEAPTEVVTEASTEAEIKSEVDQSVLYGIWAVDEAEIGGSKYSQDELEAVDLAEFMEFYLLFKEGGSAFLQISGDQNVGKWTLNADNTLTLGSMDAVYMPEDERLVLNAVESIVLYLHKISDSQKITDIPAPAEPETEAPETEAPAKDDGQVSADFKKMMDEYVEFFDKYAEFMQKYQKSDNPMGMMMDYLQMLTDYTDAMSALEGIEKTELSSADYAYYIDAMARIEKKLLEAY